MQFWNLKSSPQVQAWSLKSSPGASNPALEHQIQLWSLNPTLELEIQPWNFTSSTGQSRRMKSSFGV